MGELDLVTRCYEPSAIDSGYAYAPRTIFYAGPMLALVALLLRRFERARTDRLWPAAARSWCQVAFVLQCTSPAQWSLFTLIMLGGAAFDAVGRLPWLAAGLAVVPLHVFALGLWLRTLDRIAPASLPSVTS